MPTISAQGINFYYEDVGHGAPIVLLGGTLSTARGDFPSQIKAFSPSMRVISPERRGYGKTRPYWATGYAFVQSIRKHCS